MENELIDKYENWESELEERERQLEGGFYVKATPSLVYDTRDNIINTRRGVLAKISLEEALSFSDADSYGKLMVY